MPAARPGTVAEARTITATCDDSEAGRLAELWAAERPAASWRADLEGEAGHDCDACGGPMSWAGAHTVLICSAAHDDGKARKTASPGARDRERRHAEARAAPLRASGLSPAEAGQLGEDRAVALDGVAQVREQLGSVPRGDRFRETAVRGLHKLDRIEQRYRAARSLADLDSVHDAAEALLAEIDGVLRHAEGLDRRQRRQERGGLLRLSRRGDDEYAYDDQADDDQAEPERARPTSPASGAPLGRLVPAAVPGYLAPDPNWRQHSDAATVAYYDRIMGKLPGQIGNGARR